MVTNLWAHKEREYDGTNAGEQLPNPNFPADICDGDTPRKDSNEREQPFAKRS
jgi:hypothetical protein